MTLTLFDEELFESSLFDEDGSAERDDQLSEDSRDWPGAQCHGKHRVFFNSSVTLNDPEWELVTEKQAKLVCRGCVYTKECFLLGAEPYEASDGRLMPMPGIYGATNQWERDWIKNNPLLAIELHDQLKAEGIDPQELRLYAERHPPRELYETDFTLAEISRRWGVPRSVATYWRGITGSSKPKQTIQPWSEAIKAALEEAAGWMYRTDLITIGASKLPSQKVERKRLQIAERRRTCSRRSAEEAILDGVIRVGVKRGTFEQRKCPVTKKIQIRIRKNTSRSTLW